MPRPGPRRPIVGVRMSEDGISEIDKLSGGDVSRSDVVRVLLSEALRNPAVLRLAKARIAELRVAAAKRSR